MTTTRLASQSDEISRGGRLLRRSGLAWFFVATAGQAAFIWMIVAHYGRNSLAGDLAGWNDKPLIKGYVPGDAAGNVMFAIHVLLAAVVTLGGLLQLVPAIRRRAPALHRWNGRLFFVTAYAMALGGLWLTWVRHTYLSLISAISVSINGTLILIFAALAWRMAVTGKLDAHRRWAMRAFLVVNGVWFLRVLIMAWIMISGGGLGMNRTLSGPADVVLQFGSYLFPLAVLEAYLRARDAGVTARRLTAGLMVVATLLTAAGVVGAVIFMWGPYMI